VHFKKIVEEGCSICDDISPGSYWSARTYSNTEVWRGVVIARNESGNKAAERSLQIEKEFRTKVKPVLNRAQVLTAAALYLHEY